MERHAHYRKVLHMRGGVLTANQERLIASQPTQALKDARRRQFESYNTNLKQTEEKIARGETPAVWMEIGAENRRREAEANKLQQAINEAGGYDKYYYGDNQPIMFAPDAPDVPMSSTGSRAVSARRNIRDGNWEVTFADGSKEYAFTGDERYSLPEYKIYANNPQEFLERVGEQADRIRERQQKEYESMSGADKFFTGVNDFLSNVADVGTIFMPGLASTAYETFRPGTRAERGEQEVQNFLNRALQTKSGAELNYDNFRTGRFKSLLNYDPELKARIENYDKFGNTLQQTLGQMQGQGRERAISIVDRYDLPLPPVGFDNLRRFLYQVALEHPTMKSTNRRFIKAIQDIRMEPETIRLIERTYEEGGMPATTVDVFHKFIDIYNKTYPLGHFPDVLWEDKDKNSIDPNNTRPSSPVEEMDS